MEDEHSGFCSVLIDAPITFSLLALGGFPACFAGRLVDFRQSTTILFKADG
jgi:hypothetical protein